MRDAWLPFVRLLVSVPLLSVLAVEAAAQTATTPGQLTAYSTIYSIGLEWDIANDSDHDAAAQVTYRVAAGTTWLSGLPLVRVHDASRNMLAGSLFFLAPDTDYEVRIALSDRDGGTATRQITVRTKPLPAPPSGGRTFHVVPGAGGGDGSPGTPFRGVAAAQAAARPGDTFLLHAGHYGGRIVFATPGAPGSYIAWRAAGDGEVTMTGIDIAASHLWLEGLTVRDQQYGTRTVKAPADVVITRSFFLNNHYGIFLSSGGSGWYIADNTIVGNTDPVSGSFSGEGIELLTTSGHTVAHNSITRVADGVSYPRANVDIFGNDIFDTSDDGIELDFGRENVRVWGNRIHNPHHNGVSFQPQSGGPWYIIRNQIVGGDEAPLKFRTVDRFVLLHNTIVNWGGWMFCCQSNDIQKAFGRNNLWISAKGGQMWGVSSNARTWRTDLDYDGFDWGSGAYPFWYDGAVYYDVHAFAAASGHQTHGIRISKDSCFADFRMTAQSPQSVPPHVMALQPWCNAVDAGQPLPNINDGFVGSRPDMGAHEWGAPGPTYGPRLANAAPTVVITAPGPGSTFTAPASISLTASAHDGDGAISQVEFYNGHARIGTDTSAPFSMIWPNVSAGSYSLSARATDDSGAVATSAAVTVVVNGSTAPPVSLPGGWVQRDVGNVGATGSATESGGTYTVRASGADVWGTADEFGFVHRALTGDGAIVVRVGSLSNTDRWTKAGVMIRESLTAGSAHGFLFVTPGANGVAFQRRGATGGMSTHTPGGSGTPPVWLRLTRTGDRLTAERSANGSTWTTVGADTIRMAQTVYVGLAVTSHADGTLATATFDSLAIGASGPPPASGTPPASGSAPPAPWSSGDIGSVGVAGSVSAGSTAWVVKGAGADIWGTTDAFHYVHQPLTGDGSIVARVASMQNTDPWAKAGVMLRAGLSPGAAHAFMAVTPGKGLAFQRRRNANGTTVHTAGGSGGAGMWVKLTRTGSTVAAFRSPDGVTWTEVGRDTIGTTATVTVGLAVTSHDSRALNAATFEHVRVTQGAAAAWTHRDIGVVGAAGSTVASGSGWTLAGSGADIWGGRDEFHYAYLPMAGDFRVTVRVSSIANVDAWTKAGLMIRASTAPDAVHASLFATPTTVKGVAFQRRVTQGGSSSHTAGAALAPAVWLRLTRQGAAITAAYRQSTSDPWQVIGSDTLAGLPAAVLVGLAVTSHRDGALATAAFDSVAIEAGP